MNQPCPNCGMTRWRRGKCLECGHVEEAPKQNARGEGWRWDGMPKCAADGSTLDAKGFCPTGNAYATDIVRVRVEAGSGRRESVTTALPCPFACPHCGKALDWAGGCAHCFGAPSGSPRAWSMPGDRYEPIGGHWQVTERGPRAGVAPEQGRAAAELAVKVALGEISADEAHKVLKGTIFPLTRRQGET